MAGINYKLKIFQEIILMNSFRKIEMFFNEKGEQIDSGGKVVKNSGLVRLIYDETVIICAKFMHVTVGKEKSIVKC